MNKDKISFLKYDKEIIVDELLQTIKDLEKQDLQIKELQRQLTLTDVGCSLTLKEIDKLLNIQKVNCRVAAMRYIKDDEILNKISNAPMYDYKKQ